MEKKMHFYTSGKGDTAVNMFHDHRLRIMQFEVLEVLNYLVFLFDLTRNVCQ
jgi:hypothetical protein